MEESGRLGLVGAGPRTLLTKFKNNVDMFLVLAATVINDFVL